MTDLITTRMRTGFRWSDVCVIEERDVIQAMLDDLEEEAWRMRDEEDRNVTKKNDNDLSDLEKRRLLYLDDERLNCSNLAAINDWI